MHFRRIMCWAKILILEILTCIPAAKIFARLELDETISFLDEHQDDGR